MAFTAVKIAGGLYLIYIGWKLWSADPALASLLAARVTVPVPSEPPLRDDFAPVERYSLALLPR